ncbi:hypothetical protein A2U01_0100568, partial [Trifolium medium]|nr:hypothetical protein [Trifolium medium]
ALNRLRTDALAVTRCSDRVAKDFWKLLELFAAWLAAATGSDRCSLLARYGSLQRMVQN